MAYDDEIKFKLQYVQIKTVECKICLFTNSRFKLQYVQIKTPDPPPDPPELGDLNYSMFRLKLIILPFTPTIISNLNYSMFRLKPVN